MQLQRSFSDYYGQTQYVDKTQNETISSSGNYYIHNAVFSFHFQSRAIYLNTNSKVLLETCTFYNNSSTETGGSFYIYQSECVSVHVCVVFSSSTSWGCAYYIQPTSGNYKNYAFESSISSCTGYGTAFYKQYGDIQVSNMNSSNHKITFDAAFILQYPKGTGIMNLTTAFNTSSSSESGMMYDSGTFNIFKCNYLNNSYSGSGNGIIYTNTCTFSNCTFISNKGNRLFSRTSNINHCYFIDNEASDYPKNVESGEVLNSYISHYTTDKCYELYYKHGNNANIPDLEDNGIRSFKHLEREEIKIEDIKKIVRNVYKTSFCEAINFSSLF